MNITLTIQQNFTLWACLLLLLTVSACAVVGYFNFSSISHEIELESRGHYEKLATQYLTSEAEKQAEIIARKFNAAAETVATTAATLASLAQTPGPVRQQAITVLKEILAHHGDYVGISAGFEPDVIGGPDVQFVNTPGSDASGRFLPYLAHSNGQTILEILVGMEDDTLDSNGIRVGEYYLCVRDSLKPCVIDPYIYPIDGEDTLLSSLMAPIKNGKQFIGAVGVDINARFIQDLITDVSRNVYSGQGQVMLVSAQGIIAGNSLDPLAVGQKLARLGHPDMDLINRVLQTGVANSAESNQNLTVVVPMHFANKAGPWAVYASVPLSAVLADMDLQRQHLAAARSDFLSVLAIGGALATTLGSLAMWLVSRNVTSPLKEMTRLVQEMAEGEGDLTCELAITRNDETGHLAQNLNSFVAKLRQLITQLTHLGGQVDQLADNGNQIAMNTGQQVSSAQQAIEQVVTAVTEMSSTAQDVARSAVTAADSVLVAEQAASSGQQIVRETAAVIQVMACHVDDVQGAMSSLQQNSEQIITILTVIQSIAEQTNLLALNAAIEAARAGEQGRGFAVVADEVRALAARTRSATDDIRTMIDNLQQCSTTASRVITDNAGYVRQAAGMAKDAEQALLQIKTSVEAIGHINIQIATATEEQSLVCEDVSKSVIAISEAASGAANDGERLTRISCDLTSAAKAMSFQLARFKV